MKVTTTEKFTTHPMEDFLDLEAGTTLVETDEVVLEEATPHVAYDDKDMEIEQKFDDVYAIAMSNVVTVSDEIERVEGKYKARMGEVTANMLSVALQAAREKASFKMHKDKLSPKGSDAKTVNQTLNQLNIVADRNEMLRIIAAKKEAEK